MRKRDEWIERIKLAEQDADIAAVAVRVLSELARADPTVLPAGIRPRDVTRAAPSLAEASLVRMFAVFEAGLRQFWQDGLGRTTLPPARDLLDGVASNCNVDHPYLEAAHRVREFRNALVHEREGEPEEAFTVAEARRHLTRFFSYLPPDW